MTDIAAITALPVAAPATPAAASTSSSSSTTTTTAKAGADGATDPFAALLASLAPATDGDTTAATTTTPTTPVAVAVALPTTKAAATTPTLPATTDETPVAEHQGDDTGDAPSDDGSQDADKKDDAALAMMLALAPPPPQPTSAALPKAPVADTAASTKAVEDVTSGRRAPDAPAPKAQTTDGQSADVSTDAKAQANSRFASLAAKLFGSAAPAATAAAPAADAAAQKAAAGDAAADTAAAKAQAQVQLTAIRNAAQRDPRATPAAATTAETAAAVDRPKAKTESTDAIASIFAAPATQSSARTQDTGSTTASGTPTADAQVTRELSVGRDGQWLDTLARDIAATAGKDGQLSFRLDPQHLGSLTVHISHSADGASIRMTADTEAGRSMLADAQPRLAAEAKAQGLTLRESSVDLGGSGAGNSGQHHAASTFASLAQGQSQRDTSRDQTFINLNPAEADETAPAPEASAGSDLYA